MSARRAPGDPDDLMSVKDLAAKLTEEGDAVERSSLSRYITRHNLSHGKGPRGVTLCSYSRVRNHRRGNPDREEKGGAPIAGGSAPAAQADGAGTVDRSFDARQRERDANAALKELELARELGLVVERAEVEAGMAAVAGGFVRKSNDAARDAADKLAAELKIPTRDVPATRLAFKRLVTTMRELLAEEFRRLAGELGDGDAVEGSPARLDQLITYARELQAKPAGATEAAKA